MTARLRSTLLMTTAIALTCGVMAGAAAAPLDVALVLNVYAGDRAGPETDTDAIAMTEGGMEGVIERAGGRVVAIQQPDLTEADQGEYGRWNRYGIVSGHFADQVTANQNAGLFNVGLYNNCSGALGMLGGLRHSGDGEPLRVAMVWIDAHGDYNTPETTLSGMLGGMPAAIATGGGLHRMRTQARLDEPLLDSELVMVSVRDTDPLEQARIEENGVAMITTEDIRTLSPRIGEEMDRLAAITDLIYIHIDLDVLDPAEVPGHPLTVANGPTSVELAAALEQMFRHPKAVALGIASYPHRDDPGNVTLTAIHNLVRGSIEGVNARDEQPLGMMR